MSPHVPHPPSARASRALCDQSRAHLNPPFQNPRSATEVGTLTTKCFSLRSRTHFAKSLRLSLRFLHVCVEFFHSVDEKRRGQLIRVILMQNNFPPALGTHKGTVGPCSTGQLLDALLAVVVEAREDLGFAEVLLTNRAGNLLLQLFQTLLQCVRGFRHRNLYQNTGKFSFVFIAGELLTCLPWTTCAVQAHYRCARMCNYANKRLSALPSNSD